MRAFPIYQKGARRGAVILTQKNRLHQSQTIICTCVGAARDAIHATPDFQNK